MEKLCEKYYSIIFRNYFSIYRIKKSVLLVRIKMAHHTQIVEKINNFYRKIIIVIGANRIAEIF